MPSLDIYAVDTIKQGGVSATLFDPFGDALALRVYVEASDDLLALPSPAFQVVFQIFNSVNDVVVVKRTWNHAFQWKYSMITTGNYWDPAAYDTPYHWGLDWLSAGGGTASGGGGVFGFRAIVKAYDQTGKAFEAFSVSKPHWFRLAEVSFL